MPNSVTKMLALKLIYFAHKPFLPLSHALPTFLLQTKRWLLRHARLTRSCAEGVTCLNCCTRGRREGGGAHLIVHYIDIHTGE